MDALEVMLTIVVLEVFVSRPNVHIVDRVKGP